jgi:lysophospholipid acyltransferase (LPLAT)-like uncharacterized protein
MKREKILAALGVLLLRVLFATIRVRVDDRVGVGHNAYRKPIIMCFWHNRILGITLCFLRKYPHGQRPGVTVLTSPSHDGEILAGVVNGLGMSAVRGSSSRRGSVALRELVRCIESSGDVAITPDGPRYSFGPGAVLLAQATGAALVPMHAKFSHCIRMKTWDNFIIPLPFSSISVIMDATIPVPHDLTKEEFEATRARIQTLLTNEAD